MGSSTSSDSSRLGRLWRRGTALVRGEAARIGFDLPLFIIAAWAAAALLWSGYDEGQWLRAFYTRWLGAGAAATLRDMALNQRFLVQFVIPVALLIAMRERLRDHGLGLGNIRLGLTCCAVCYVLYIPCFVVLFLNPGFQEYYAWVTRRYDSMGAFFAREGPAVAVLSLQTEFFFRGFLQSRAAQRYGAFAGILLGLIPYVLVHAGKAPLEAFGSLPVGFALGYLAYKTGSVYYGVLLHGSIALMLNGLILLLHLWGRGPVS